MKGVLLLAIGNNAYLYWAYNQALSIKYHSPDVKIQLLTEKKVIEYFDLKHRQFFDKITLINEEDAYETTNKRGVIYKRLFPAKAKLKLYDYTTFQETIYFDVDGLTIKPIESLFEKCVKDYQSQVVGRGQYQEKAWGNMIWALPSVIYPHYKLPHDTIIPFLNSSFAFFKKSALADKLYRQAYSNLMNAIPLEKLHYQWGHNQPDELYMNIALGQLGIDPSGVEPIYFSMYKKQPLPISEVFSRYYGIGMWGDRMLNHVKIKQLYEISLRDYSRKFGHGTEFKLCNLWNTKFVVAGKKPIR